MTIEHQINHYLDALKTYNVHTNIYSTHAYDRLDFHVQDCLTLAGLIGNDPVRVLDIGSGSGFPAVIIAIKNPKTPIAVKGAVEKPKIPLRPNWKSLVNDIFVLPCSLLFFTTSTPVGF